MPHLHMEYTNNLPGLDADKVLLQLNHALAASGQFANAVDIKSRASTLATFQVGITSGEHAFVHVKLAILSGRSPEIKRQLSESLLAVLLESAPWPAGLDIQLAVEILDIDRDSYAKAHFGG